MRSWPSPLRLHRRQTALLRDNRVELLIDGGPFFSAVVDAIESAKEYVLMETYIVADDKTGGRIQEVLIERAAAGVEVAFVYDAFGSLGLDDKYINILHQAGVKTHKFRPFTFMRIKRWAKRNHRKLLVVDGRIAVVGGMNISDHYAALEDGGQAWRDTAVCVQGPAVAQLEELFRKMWTLNSRQILRSLACKPPSFPGGHQVRFLANYGRADRADIHRAYLHAIKDAQKTIRIMTAYFTPDRRLLAALGRAAKRGVTVEIITAGATDLEVILHASRGLYANLLRHGVHIYEWHERVLHAKTAVIDGQWSTVGSANLNHRTWLLDQEVNATIFGEKFAKQMDQQFASDRARCKVISRQMWKARPRWRRLVEWFFGLFRRLI